MRLEGEKGRSVIQSEPAQTRPHVAQALAQAAETLPLLDAQPPALPEEVARAAEREQLVDAGFEGGAAVLQQAAGESGLRVLQLPLCPPLLRAGELKQRAPRGLQAPRVDESAAQRPATERRDRKSVV